MMQTNLVNPSFHTFMTSISESRSLLNKIIFIQILGISGATTSFPQESHNFDENNFFWPERVDAPTSMSCLQYVVPRTPATVQSCLFIFSFYSHNSGSGIRGFHTRSPLPFSLVLTNQLKDLHRGKGAWVEWRHEGDVDVEVILA